MVTEKNGCILVDVIAKPGSRMEKLEWDGEKLTARVNAKPIDGQANKALIELVSGRLGIPKRSVCIEAGERGKHKRVRIEGVDLNGFLARLKG